MLLFRIYIRTLREEIPHNVRPALFRGAHQIRVDIPCVL